MARRPGKVKAHTGGADGNRPASPWNSTSARSSTGYGSCGGRWWNSRRKTPCTIEGLVLQPFEDLSLCIPGVNCSEGIHLAYGDRQPMELMLHQTRRNAMNEPMSSGRAASELRVRRPEGGSVWVAARLVDAQFELMACRTTIAGDAAFKQSSHAQSNRRTQVLGRPEG